MPKLLAERIQDALDVSGAFDNCFFHTYALHLIANDLPFPDDLFSFRPILGAHSVAVKIRKELPDFASLSMFSEFFKRNQQNAVPLSPSFIVEKTLILGFLLREWFATKLHDNLKVRDAMKDSVIGQFKHYVAVRPSQEDGYANLVLGEGGVLYEANLDFLEYASSRPKNAPLTKKETAFEQYFTSHATEDEAFAAYWLEHGYRNYCTHYANAGIKLSKNDVTPVLQMNGQAITFYNPNSSILEEIPGNASLPKMEVKLDSSSGHYFLLGTDATAPMLGEYAKSYEKYLQDRKEVLLLPGSKIAAANKKSSLFVGAICPRGVLEYSAITVLLDKIKFMKNFILQFDKKPPVAAVLPKSKNIVKIDKALKTLKTKIGDIDKHSSTKACLAANQLLDSLTSARNAYQINLNNPDMDTNAANKQFTKQCNASIDSVYSILAKDLGWGPYLRNLLKTLANAVITLATFGIAGTFFTSEISPSVQAILQVTKDLKPTAEPEKKVEDSADWGLNL